MPVISLLTDFSVYGPHVGIVKGVLITRCPHCTVVDITHEVPRFNIPAGAYILREAYSSFPAGTVHLAVVDPTVGSERKCIAVKTKHYWFVAPDNGLVWPAASRDGIVSVWHVDTARFSPSSTFHARDIFAPVAAFIARGDRIENFATEMPPDTMVKLDLSAYAFADQFGNVETPLRVKPRRVILNGNPLRIVRTYADGNQGELFALVNSRGYLELACREAPAIEKTGETIELQVDDKKYTFKVISILPK